MSFDGDQAIRAGAVQALLVVVVALVLAVALPGDFFSDWGWLTGPAAWLGCAAIVARRLQMPTFLTMVGAALAGLPMLLALAIGLHWPGVLVGLVAFGCWCGTLPSRRPRGPREPRVSRREPGR
ncbi:MAG TPA: hypothetical protein VFD37_05295 [Solirubrobacterales bacterium]|nr:hypothetical protein [Solirubrobacterales bacterium]